MTHAVIPSLVRFLHGMSTLHISALGAQSGSSAASKSSRVLLSSQIACSSERDLFIDNLLVRIHSIIPDRLLDTSESLTDSLTG